jgi:hypothetical protein
MRYFRYRWNKTPGGDKSHWGCSTWYFAVEGDTVVKQWEVYDGGVVLIYDVQRVEDEHGGLSDQPSDPAEALAEGVEEIDQATFRAATANLSRRPPQS